MLHDGAEIIKATSTKYTLMGKISIEDGSNYSTELRQGCELISTAVFMVHQPLGGCARPTRLIMRQKAGSVIKAVTTLIESFVSLKAVEKNVGAQLTGAVWSACDEILTKLPKGNRACMRRELFTWVGECNETMQEFQDLIELGPEDETESASTSEGQEKEKDSGGGIEVEGEEWDDFCENMGTGEQYTLKEMPIVTASLALVKCSRGIIGLAMKACECAGQVVASLETDDDNHNQEDDNQEEEEATVRKMAILQWISDLHEMCWTIGVGATDLGCVMYPPLDLSSSDWAKTELGSQVLQQKTCLLSAAHAINNPVLVQGGVIEMSEEVKEMCSKLLSAIETRADEVEKGISDELSNK